MLVVAASWPGTVGQLSESSGKPSPSVSIMDSKFVNVHISSRHEPCIGYIISGDSSISSDTIIMTTYNKYT